MPRAHTDALAVTAVPQPAGVVRALTVSLCAKLTGLLSARRAAGQLSEMSDWQLADIGLTRCDVDTAALSVPRAQMTRQLQTVAHERARMAAIHGAAGHKS